MKAFVKTNNGTFPNINFYCAWEAFNTLGYDVVCFEEKDLDKLDITIHTPLFAGVTVFRKAIDKLGVNYPPFDCYPEVLNPHYARKIEKSTLGEVRAKFNDDEIPVFVKPIKPKEFNGVVLKSMLDLLPIYTKKDDVPVYVSDPIDIVSEFRVYVMEGEILAVKHYYGEWQIIPDIKFVEEVVRNYKPSPVAYGVDVGVTNNGQNFVIEANDGCNLGNYGLDSIHYGKMIIARWVEIVGGGNNKSDGLKNLMQARAEEIRKSLHR
jgi:hypothetical protein